MPIVNESDYEQKTLEMIPVGYQVLQVDEATTKISRTGRRMYNLVLSPRNLIGDFKNVYLNLFEDTLHHVTLSFFEAAQISIGRKFLPEFRYSDDNPGSYLDIEVGGNGDPLPNMISHNLVGRVVEGCVIHGSYEGKPKCEIDINAEPPFRPYFENGQAFVQPRIVKLNAPQAVGDHAPSSIAPPPEDSEEGGIDNPIPLED